MKENLTDKELVAECLRNNSEAQKVFYKRFAPRAYGICLRFSHGNNQADDILQEGFIKVFGNLSKFRFEGSLEGWIKRIVVNVAIDYIKKNVKHFQELNDNIDESADIFENEIISKLSAEDLMQMVQELPDSKRLIFNLYAYEGYAHKEIAEMLGISVMTSKSQYCKAKKILQERLSNIKNKSYERVH
jgi:RNA polymerase sigma-70 factor (ECF subfamily)